MGTVLRFNHHLEAAYMEWQREAACLAVDTAMFYPGPHANQDEAKAVCAECPVLRRCLDYAMAKPERFGIWGGLNERERKRLQREAS